jgi:mannosyltransferase OCH1-like enzyme
MIPKKIHQLWIGPKPAPTKFMDTWKEKHPDYEYLRWNEKKIEDEKINFECQTQINQMEELNGKADIIRWELLYKYGGIFLDADSICIKEFDDLLNDNKSFFSYENEHVRGAGWGRGNKMYDLALANTHPLVATGTMAFPPKHPLVRMAIDWIKSQRTVSVKETGMRAWLTVGPGLLTRCFFSKKWDDIKVLPSYYFLPIHASGLEYRGHRCIYAYQEWGSTKNTYNVMNSIELPRQFKSPHDGRSVILDGKELSISQIRDKISHIIDNEEHINIECILLISDNKIIKTCIERIINELEKTTRFMKFVVYTNVGLDYIINNNKHTYPFI